MSRVNPVLSTKLCHCRQSTVLKFGTGATSLFTMIHCTLVSFLCHIIFIANFSSMVCHMWRFHFQHGLIRIGLHQGLGPRTWGFRTPIIDCIFGLKIGPKIEDWFFQTRRRFLIIIWARYVEICSKVMPHERHFMLSYLGSIA